MNECAAIKNIFIFSHNPGKEIQFSVEFGRDQVAQLGTYNNMGSLPSHSCYHSIKDHSD